MILINILVWISAVCGQEGKVVFPLAKNGKNIPVIYYAEGQDFAAKELSYILEKMTKAKFPVSPVEKVVKGPAFIIGKTAEAKKAGADFSGFEPDEWFVKKVGDRIILSGGGHHGSLYAVYELMEKFGGVSFPALDIEIIPEKEELLLPEDLIIQGKPAFIHRTVFDGIVGGKRSFKDELKEKRRVFAGQSSMINARLIGSRIIFIYLSLRKNISRLIRNIIP